jgi:hypothetical protein
MRLLDNNCAVPHPVAHCAQPPVFVVSFVLVIPLRFPVMIPRLRSLVVAAVLWLSVALSSTSARPSCCLFSLWPAWGHAAVSRRPLPWQPTSAHVSPPPCAHRKAQVGPARLTASSARVLPSFPLPFPSLPFPSPCPSSVAQPFSCFLCGLCCAAARAAGAGGAERSRAAQRHAAGERREKGKGQARQRGAASLGHCGHLRAPHALPAHLFFVAICARSATSSARAAL